MLWISQYIYIFYYINYNLLDEFYEYLTYSKNLEFEETPDYNYLRNLFKNLMDKNNFNYDLEFDWIINSKRIQEEKKELTNIIEGQYFQKIVKKNLII